MEEYKVLELRMYFLVPYNISPIQQAIQAGHAALEYAHRYAEDETFIEFVEKHKTWIILNGGTTNDQRDFDGIPQGSLNLIADKLHDNAISFTYFREPDLNDALTALCFICDERVFNRKDYPDLIEHILSKIPVEDEDNYTKAMINGSKDELLAENFPEYYKEWVRLMGGMKNVFLRELLKDKKLA
jgi:hypothetical protein